MGMIKTTLKEISLNITDGTHSTVKNDPEGDYYLLSCKNIKNGLINFTENDRRINKETFLKLKKRTNLQVNDILITTVGTIGEVALIRDKNINFELQRSVGIVKPNNKIIEPKYLRYYFSSPKYQGHIYGLSRGVAQQCLFLKPLGESIVEYPESLEEQQKIATILSNYDDLIENNNKRIELLEKTAKLIYDEWLVKFKFPGHSEVEMVDSELGKIPKGWKLGQVKDLYIVQPGYAFKSKDFQNSGFPVIKIKNIKEDKSIDTVNVDFISEEVGNKAERFKLNKGDLLIAMTGATIGKVGILSEDKSHYYLNQLVARFISKESNSYLNYLYFFINNGSFRTTIENIALGAAQPNISGGYIESIKMIKPPKETLDNFCKIVTPFIQEIIFLRNKNKNLQETRDLLLPKLINNKIDISNLDIKVPEVEA